MAIRNTTTPYVGRNLRAVQLQRGGVTILAAIMILLLMTVMMFYGARVSLFEQRSSSNEAQQKRAFHLAEAGRGSASNLFLSVADDLVGTDAGEWLEPGNVRWVLCGRTETALPCGAETDLDRRENTFKYVNPNDATDNLLPINTAWVDGAGDQADLGGVELNDERLEVTALLCRLSVVGGVNTCTSAPGADDDEFAITIISQAWTDNGRSEAVVRDLIATYDVSNGAPAVPFIVQAGINVTGGGTFDIVANPNAGGEGVPVSIWMGSSLDSNGSWRTCEAYEYYRSIEPPADVECVGNGNNNCNCERGSELSDAKTRFNDIVDADIDMPEIFPTFFGVPKAEYGSVRSGMQQVANCGELSSSSSGQIWVDGACDVKDAAGTQIGTADDPVLMVVNGNFRMNAQSTVFGIVFVTNAGCDPCSRDISMNAGATVYGAVLIDHDVDRFNGGFSIVYNEAIINRATDGNALAPVPGGWADFL